MRQIKADLRSAKEVLARIHEIVLAKSSPFLMTVIVTVTVTGTISIIITIIGTSLG